MAYNEDQIALAAEYALGTLDGGERAQVEALMAADRDYAGLVESWQFRLSVLNQMVGLVEPRPEVWDRIKAEIAASLPPAPVAQPEPEIVREPLQPAQAELPEQPQDLPAPEVEAPVTPSVTAPELLQVPPAIDDSGVIQLASKVRQWRTVANAMTALAAALLAVLSVQVYRPELLPNVLRPKQLTQIVEVKAPSAPSSAQYVALLQKDAASPAFILTVEAASKNFTVRRVGAAPEPGKSFELWLVSDRLQRPRSLGVIGGSDFTTRPLLSAYDADTVNRATYAVTLEPEGGSPTGAATGPIVFSGKLLETVPAPGTAVPPR